MEAIRDQKEGEFTAKFSLKITLLAMSHLNWSWVFVYLITQGLLVAVAPNDIGAGVTISILVMIPVSAWVLNQKGRSLGWLALMGLLSPLWLKNKKSEPKRTVRE